MHHNEEVSVRFFLIKSFQHMTLRFFSTRYLVSWSDLGSIVSTHGLTAEGTMVRYEHLLIFTTLTWMLSDLLIPSPKQ